MQPRHIARELALLSISQLPSHQNLAAPEQLSSLLLAAVRTLASEVRDALENAATGLERGRKHLLDSEIRILDRKLRVDEVQTTRATVNIALEATKTAINQLAKALQLPRSQPTAKTTTRPGEWSTPQEQEQERQNLKAVRTLTAEAHSALEQAGKELARSQEHLPDGESPAELQAAKASIEDAIAAIEGAINHLGAAVDLPEFIQLANQEEVQSYALSIVQTFNAHRDEVDELLVQSLVDWQLERLARIDRDILRIAVTEIRFLAVPDRIAINEAVELAKRYSSDEGHRFINGVLRRVTNQMESSSP